MKTSNIDGDCFIETSNLDGETNLKIKFAEKNMNMLNLKDYQNSFYEISYERPNPYAYFFSGFKNDLNYYFIKFYIHFSFKFTIIKMIIKDILIIKKMKI